MAAILAELKAAGATSLREIAAGLMARSIPRHGAGRGARPRSPACSRERQSLRNEEGVACAIVTQEKRDFNHGLNQGRASPAPARANATAVRGAP